jgi:hypothetical protein
MNYDLCDLLNRKLEQQCSYLQEKNLNRSVFKYQNSIDKIFEDIAPEEYLETIENVENEQDVFAHWLYRNGKLSNQLPEFEMSAKKITRELANLSYSNNPVVDLMYFSGIAKVLYSSNKVIYIECCIRPSLDQMLTIKDLEKNLLKENGTIVWKIVERRGKNNHYQGAGAESLHGFKWSRIK